MLGALWWILTSPFRLIGWTIDLCGRIVAVVLGFLLMVFGAALCAAAFLVVGIPLFLIGLILALKAL